MDAFFTVTTISANPISMTPPQEDLLLFHPPEDTRCMRESIIVHPRARVSCFVDWILSSAFRKKKYSRDNISKRSKTTQFWFTCILNNLIIWKCLQNFNKTQTVLEDRENSWYDSLKKVLGLNFYQHTVFFLRSTRKINKKSICACYDLHFGKIRF